MKSLARAFFAALVLGLFTISAFAQDTAAGSVSSDASPLVFGVIIVMAVLLVAAGVYGAYITRFLATMVPAETAASIYQSGVRFAIEFGLNQAAVTETELDDKFFLGLAEQRNLPVTKHPDGSYSVLIPPSATPE